MSYLFCLFFLVLPQSVSVLEIDRRHLGHGRDDRRTVLRPRCRVLRVRVEVPTGTMSDDPTGKDSNSNTNLIEPFDLTLCTVDRSRHTEPLT